MSDKRYSGNIISSTPVEPSGPYEGDAASGVWSLAEAFAYTKAGLWPTAGRAQKALISVAFMSNLVAPPNVIEFVTISTLGNSADFGDLTQSRATGTACSSSTRGVFMGGQAADVTQYNTIDYVTIASSGNATDFGDLLNNTARDPGGCSNATRGLCFGGDNGGDINTIQYITIASVGNALDFGDMSAAAEGNAACANSTTALVHLGFHSGSRQNIVEFVTISTTGNSADFGDISSARAEVAALSSSTKGFFFGGNIGSPTFAAQNVIETMTFATAGNSTDFGDLLSGIIQSQGTSGGDRALVMGASGSNVIQYFSMSTTGNAIDFGDLINGSTSRGGCCSDAHGGLS